MHLQLDKKDALEDHTENLQKSRKIVPKKKKSKKLSQAQFILVKSIPPIGGHLPFAHVPDNGFLPRILVMQFSNEVKFRRCISLHIFFLSPPFSPRSY